MIKINRIPTIIGVIILVAGTFLGVFYLNVRQIFGIGASAGSSPKNVRISNISDTSATITWTTDASSTDFISWGGSSGSLDKVTAEDSSGGKYITHSVILTGLSPSTNYFFKINSDGTVFDNASAPWEATTGPNIGVGSVSLPISGTVINASGQPEKRAIVYLSVEGYLESTITSDSGNFIFQLGSARSTDLQNYLTVDPAKTLLEVSVDASTNGVSSVQIFPQSASPIPTIILGQVQDYRSLQPTANSVNPNANFTLPQASTPESKFNVSSPSGTPKPTSVLLENLTQGESITTDKPQFIGRGPGGESITITVHSQNPVTQKVTIQQNGTWSWTPPSSLEPGSHSITISWIDALGITRTLTRDFIVQAGEAPAFTASQSGSTSTPSPTPLTSGTPVPTLIPSSTATATAEPVPVTGDLTPTLILSIMGLSFVAFSFAIWKLAES